MHPLTVFVAMALIPFASTLEAQSEDIRKAPLRFEAGSTETSIKDTITGYQSVSHTIGLEAGRRLSVTLEPSNTATYFNVYEPGRGPGDQALANAGAIGDLVPDLNRFDAIVQLSGTYTVSVYMMRSAARRDEVSDYVLTVVMDASGPVDGPVQADFADGLQGGPDYWQVKTSTVDSGLNIRDAPSIGATVVSVARGDAILRNLGCRMAEGRRWCSIKEPNGNVSGWAAGDFLIESAAPSNAN